MRKITLRIFLLLLVLSILLSFFKPDYWYNTMLCFGAGITFSIHKYKFEKLVKRNYKKTIIVLLAICSILYCSPIGCRGVVYNVFSISFCLLIVSFTMKLQLRNEILTWFGRNLFPLYIYQRIPMILLLTVDGGILCSSYPILFVILCFLITSIIAHFYPRFAITLK